MTTAANHPRWMPYQAQPVAAGVYWSAVAIPVERGGRLVLDFLTARHGEDAGPVICDPVNRRMYFLVPPTTVWHLPGTRLLGTNAHVVLPPAFLRSGTGLHWASLPAGPEDLIDPDEIREALILPSA